jgi:hypothetical protein
MENALVRKLLDEVRQMVLPRNRLIQRFPTSRLVGPARKASWHSLFVTEVRFRREGNGVCGQALQKPRMKSCGVCALGCSAFRGSNRFTVSRCVQKGTGISLFAARFVSIRQIHAAQQYDKPRRDRQLRFDSDTMYTPGLPAQGFRCLWKKERLSGLGRAMPFVAGRGDCPPAPSSPRISRSSQRSGEA